MIENNCESFKCPECGGTEIEDELYVNTVPNSNDPWSSVLQVIYCSSCHLGIPAHIGERWDDMTEEDARVEWKDKYRKGSIKIKKRKY